MKNPMLSVEKVSSTEEPSAGSRPSRCSASGTPIATIAASSRFSIIAIIITQPSVGPCGVSR